MASPGTLIVASVPRNQRLSPSPAEDHIGGPASGCLLRPEVLERLAITARIVDRFETMISSAPSDSSFQTPRQVCGGTRIASSRLRASTS